MCNCNTNCENHPSIYAISASLPEEANLNSGFTLVNSDTSLQLRSPILNENLLIYFQFTVRDFLLGISLTQMTSRLDWFQGSFGIDYSASCEGRGSGGTFKRRLAQELLCSFINAFLYFNLVAWFF